MSSSTDYQNITEQIFIKGLRDLFAKNKSERKLQSNLNIFNYLSSHKDIWLKSEKMESFALKTKKKLIEYEINEFEKFPYSNLFLVDFKFRCKWVTKKGTQCKKKPYDGVCKVHIKYVEKMNIYITKYCPIKNLTNIIVDYAISDQCLAKGFIGVKL